MNLDHNISIQDPVVIYELIGKITTEEDYKPLERAVFDHLNQNYYRIIFDLLNDLDYCCSIDLNVCIALNNGDMGCVENANKNMVKHGTVLKVIHSSVEAPQHVFTNFLLTSPNQRQNGFYT